MEPTIGQRLADAAGEACTFGEPTPPKLTWL
jgi:hypothetical protein